MSFHDVSLPDDFQYGSTFGAGFSTVVQQTASGHEYRISRQSAPRHQFRLRKTLQNDAEASTLKTFILARRGALHSWRLKDWSDFTTNENGVGAHDALDVALGTGDGTTTQFQLVKHYAEGVSGTLTRTITLPVAGTTLVKLAGTAKTEGVHYSVTSPGGIITFGTAPGVGEAVTAGFEFDVPVRFELSVDEWQGIRADAFAVWSLGDIACIEVLDEVQYPERWYPGGYTNWGTDVAVDITLSLAQGSLHTIDPSADINAFLPAPPTLFPGGTEIFTITVPSGASHSVQVRDDAGNIVGSAISAGNTKKIAGYLSGSTWTWVLY